MTLVGNFSPLVLVGDSDRVEAETVGAYLDGWAGHDKVRLATANAIKAILSGAGRLVGRIARGYLPGDPGKLVGSIVTRISKRALMSDRTIYSLSF